MATPDQGFMLKKHKDILIEKRTDIISVLNIDDIFDHLYQEKIISVDIKEKLKNPSLTSRDRNAMLLDHLPKRTSGTMKQFIRILIKTDQQHIASIIDQGLVNDVLREQGDESVDGYVETLTTAVPPVSVDAQQFTMPSQSSTRSTNSPAPRTVTGPRTFCTVTREEYLRFFDDISMYRMSGQVRGLVIIINNETFTSGNSNRPQSFRDGSNKDARELKKMFEELKFQVVPYTDLTASEIFAEIEATKNRASKDHDAFICVILSHGNAMDKIYGSDNVPVLSDDIIERLDGKFFPVFATKPKIVVIQACRGAKQLTGVVADGGSGDYFHLDDQLARDFGKLTISHKNAHMYTVRSTTPDHVSWRDKANGGVFTQSFIDNMYRHAHNMHLEDIMTIVRREMNERRSGDEIGEMQLAVSVSQLCKKIYFFPGYP